MSLATGDVGGLGADHEPDGPGAPEPQLHRPDRRLDLAFSALREASAGAFLHCLGQTGSATERSPMLGELLPHARLLPNDRHALTYVDPADHLRVHGVWLEACHGPTRVARTTVRTVVPIESLDGGEPGPIGVYGVTVIDLVGTDGIDTVLVVIVPARAARDATATVRPPSGEATFRLDLDPLGTIKAGTEAVGSVLGHPLDDLVGTPIEPLIHRDDLAEATGTWQDVVAHPDRAQSVRVRLHLADGSWRWFSITTWNALANPDLEAILVEFHDVQEAVEAEQALHACELGYRTLAESMPVGVALLDADGRVHFANHRLVAILANAGLTGPESPIPSPRDVGPGFTTRWEEFVRADVVADLADLVRPGDPDERVPVSRQIAVAGPGGDRLHLLVTAATIRNPDGLSVIVTIQDVTDSVLATQAHDHLVQVVNEVDELVMVTNLSGDVSYMNAAARAYLGVHERHATLREALRPELLRHIDEQVVPSLRRHERWSGDLEVEDRDGRMRVMATSIRPVLDADGPDLHVGVSMRDVTAERAHARDLAAQARQDHLTGLPNRLALMELLGAMRVDADADASPTDQITLYFIDLDNLKIVNDGLGHSAGDRLLQAVADELEQVAIPDRVFRFGGDEFVVACRRDGPEEAMATAEQLLDAVRRVHVHGVASNLSASIGVAGSLRAELDPEGLVRDADAAMYAAKRAGRNRCARFDDSLRQRAQRRFVLETALRGALTDGTLEVHLQPVVDVSTGLVSGFESLCRWHGSSPAEFIPVAEDSGLIVPLGREVLERSLRAARILRNSAPQLADLQIGVNVSARELDEPGFAARTLQIIGASGLPATHVVLELTESVLIDPSDDVGQSLRQLRDAGVQLALDDFGVGYSSISYLRRYPVQVLKLDVTYTQAAITDPGTRVIVEAIVSMANRLGLRVVAEGVETLEQLDLIRDLGVTWGQGYLLGRPAPLSDLLTADLTQPVPGYHPELTTPPHP